MKAVSRAFGFAPWAKGFDEVEAVELVERDGVGARRGVERVHVDSGIQRRAAVAIAGVWVCAMFEEEGREIEVEVDNGFEQGCRTVGIGEVHVGFGIDQCASGFEIVLARGEQKCGEAAAR